MPVVQGDHADVKLSHCRHVTSQQHIHGITRGLCAETISEIS